MNDRCNDVYILNCYCNHCQGTHTELKVNGALVEQDSFVSKVMNPSIFLQGKIDSLDKVIMKMKGLQRNPRFYVKY